MQDLIKVGNSPKEFLKKIPKNSGIYKFLGLNKEVLYIGKAKNLHKRLISYFRISKTTSPKLKSLIKEAKFLNIIITDSELEALLLEQHEIKEHRPKYNVVFKDDKGYPWIRVGISKNYPSVTLYRGKKVGKDLFFGPFPSTNATREVIDLIQKFFNLRNCSETFFKNRSRPCMQAQIGRCSAPCVGGIENEEYLKEVNSVRKLLEGKSEDLLEELYLLMDQQSKEKNYERAALYRDKISALREIQRGQSSAGFLQERDAIICLGKDGNYKIGLTEVRGGWIVSHRNFSFKGSVYDKSILEIFILDHYISKGNRPPKAIVLDERLMNKKGTEKALNFYHKKTTRIITQPKKKDKGLVKIALSNTEFSLDRAGNKRNLRSQLSGLRKLIGCKKEIKVINSIDISHYSGTNAVGGCVVYGKYGKEVKNYRLYNISKENSGDDINSIKEVISRRYKESSKKGRVLPDLLLIDGGRAHLNSVKELLKSMDISEIEILSVSKGIRRKKNFDSIHIENRSVIKVNKNSLVHLLIQEIRDETHRFAINSQRYKYLKSASKSSLDSLPGVGKERKLSLIRYFGSVEQIKRANINDLVHVLGIGPQVAKQIYNHFH